MFLDTSAIVELFRNEPGSPMFEKIFEIIGNEPLYISVVQLAEFSDWSIRNGHDVSDQVNILKMLVNILPMNEMICLKASQMKNEMQRKGIEKFGLIDGIVLASAQSINQKLLTTDTDFRDARYVEFMEDSYKILDSKENWSSLDDL